MIDRAALAATIKEKSPLTLEQIESLFGGEANEANKAVIWRFVNMSDAQQQSIWQAYLRIKHLAPDFIVEAVR